MPLPIGTITNVITVLAGGLVGLLLHKRFPERIQSIIFQALGLFTLTIGFIMAIKLKNPIIIVVSLISGGILGELLQLETRITGLSERIKRLLRLKGEGFSDGLITAFTIFCIGSMTIVGAIDEGLKNDPTLLITKAIMDGFMATILGTTYGVGVLFSIIPLFIFQYGITLISTFSKDFFSPFLIDQLSALGGILILGISIKLLGAAKIRLLNLLPSIVIIVIITFIYEIVFL